MNIFITMLTLLLTFILSFSSSPAFADRCDDLYTESCKSSDKPLPDTTGLLRNKGSLEEQRKLYQSARAHLRQQLSDWIASDADIKKQVESTGNFEKVFGYFAQQYEYLNPEAAVTGADTISTASLTNDEPANSVQSFEIFSKLEANPKMDEIQKRVTEGIYAKAAPAFQRNYLQNTLFPQIKISAKKILAQLPDGPEKKALLAKIDLTTFSINDCDLNLMDIDTFYDPPTGQVNYCYSLMFKNSSAYAEIHTLAHELAHSIDPCVMPAQASVWSPLVACLRKPSSIQAKVSSPLPSASRCMGNGYSEDQIGESFADWFGVEVLNDLTNHLTLAMKKSDANTFGNGISNVFRAVCSIPISAADQAYYDANFDVHPEDKDRVLLLTAQPEIRKRMGCTSAPKKTYCEINGGNPSDGQGVNSVR